MYCTTSVSYDTVKRLYFAGRIFRGFRELAYIREINFQRKLCHRQVIRIFTSFVRPVHRMALCKFFKKAPSALSNPNGSLSGRMPLEAIFSATREISVLVRQDTGQNGKTINKTR